MASKAVTDHVGKLFDLFRKSLNQQADPMFLNALFFRAGEAAIVLNEELAELEANRKTVHFEIRDRLMAEAEEKGEKLSRTAATEEARTHPDYLSYVEQIESVRRLAERAQLLADAAKQRAWISKTIMEIEAGQARAGAELAAAGGE